jgi:hypothetical protein
MTRQFHQSHRVLDELQQKKHDGPAVASSTRRDSCNTNLPPPPDPFAVEQANLINRTLTRSLRNKRKSIGRKASHVSRTLPRLMALSSTSLPDDRCIRLSKLVCYCLIIVRGLNLSKPEPHRKAKPAKPFYHIRQWPWTLPAGCNEPTTKSQRAPTFQMAFCGRGIIIAV